MKFPISELVNLPLSPRCATSWLCPRFQHSCIIFRLYHWMRSVCYKNILSVEWLSKSSQRPKSHPLSRNNPSSASKKARTRQKNYIFTKPTLCFVDWWNIPILFRNYNEIVRISSFFFLALFPEWAINLSIPQLHSQISPLAAAEEIDSYHDVPCVAITISPQCDVRVDPKIILCAFPTSRPPSPSISFTPLTQIDCRTLGK